MNPSPRMPRTSPSPQPRSVTTWEWYAPPSRLETLAESFDPIGLKQMEGVALLNRIDAKFIMSTGQLLQALAALQPSYWMLAVQGRRLNHYRTLYFDTSSFDLYHWHVNERAERYKVRSREYVDSRSAFLEVKHKTRKGRTIKDRLPTPRPVEELTPELSRWLNGVLPMDTPWLEPQLWNSFMRLTLVNKRACERVTLDVDLLFYTADNTAALEGLVIAEVKRPAHPATSPFVAQMRAQRIRQHGFSKYVMGASLLCPQVKKNSLKPKRLEIEKILKGNTLYD